MHTPEYNSDPCIDMAPRKLSKEPVHLENDEDFLYILSLHAEHTHLPQEGFFQQVNAYKTWIHNTSLTHFTCQNFSWTQRSIGYLALDSQYHDVYIKMSHAQVVNGRSSHFCQLIHCEWISVITPSLNWWPSLLGNGFLLFRLPGSPIGTGCPLTHCRPNWKWHDNCLR